MAGLLLVAGLAFAGIAVVSGRSSDDSTSGPSGSAGAKGGTGGDKGVNNIVAPPADFSGAPRTTWQVRPSDFSPGATRFEPAVATDSTDTTRLGSEAAYGTSSFAVGLQGGDEGSSTTLGLSSTTGSVLWELPERTECFFLKAKDTFACAGPGKTYFIDERTSKVSTVDDDEWLSAVFDGPGDTIFTLAFVDGDDGRAVVTRGTVADPARMWSKELSLSSAGSTPDLSSDYNHDNVVLRAYGAEVLLRIKDGKELAIKNGRQGYLWPSGLEWRGANEEYVSQGFVDARTGKTPFTTNAYPWYDAEDYGPWSDGGNIGLGDSIVRASDGKPVRTAPGEVVIAGAFPRAGLALQDFEGTGEVGEKMYDLDTLKQVGPLDKIATATPPLDAPGAIVQVTDSGEVTAHSGKGVDWRTTLPSSYQVDREYSRTDQGATEDALVFSNADTIIGLTDFDSTGSALAAGTTTYKTPCGKEVKAEPVEARTVDDTVEVTMVLKATCPGGQLVDGTNTVLSLSSSSSSSGSQELLARTSFDFSRSPVWVGEDDERRVVVRYPVGTVWAPTDDIEKAIADKTVIVDCEHSTSKSGKDKPDDDAKNAESHPTFVGYGPNKETRAEANDNALAALRRQAALDADKVAGLEGLWVPQLSSKLNGTFDAVDNHTYDYSDIWNEHLRLRLRYPDALLLNSTDWRSYRNPGFWVTVVGPTRDDWKPVLTWCTDEGFPDSHCGAKRLLRAGPLEGSYHTRSE